MRYCKYLSLENGTSLSRYALVEKRSGVLWATLPMQAPQEDLSSRILGGLPVPTLDVDFEPTPLSDLHLLPPVAPSKIVCVGRNYSDHAAELGNEVPTEPLLFLKPPSSLLPAGGIVERPAISNRVDFEGELAIVIGKRARKLAAGADVAPYIHGYTCLNDITARDIQKSDPQWTRGKGFDTFCPTGPIVSNEINPLAENILLVTRLNGEVKQRGETRDLIFTIPHLIHYISQCMTLEPGDLIATGTPSGVAPMQSGDIIEVEITGLATLRNPIQ